jgi:deazaflavin-dependent oxidoreductase (nitroreductase family)
MNALTPVNDLSRSREPALRASRGVAEEVFDNPTGWVARHIRRYVESGGTRGHRFRGNDVLLLTTRGRRTGKLRRTALYYARDGERYVVVATDVRGGGDPAWYRNLLRSPAVVVQVRSEVFAAVARPAAASERQRLWQLMVRAVPKFVAYAEEAGRELPVVVLERAHDLSGRAGR